MDYEVCRKIWESQVPVQFILQSNGQMAEPLPFYTMLPRFSYLALTLPKVLAYFNRREEVEEKMNGENEWLEVNGNPVKLYVPIGVIYDQQNLESDSILEITVKTKNPPENYIQVDRNSMEAMFMQSVKEADYLKTKAATTNNMQREEFTQLWKSVTTNNFDEYWRIIQKLMEVKDGKEFDSVPLRVYVKRQPFKQILLTTKDETGALRTIGDAVSQVLASSQSSTEPSSTPPPLRLISHGIDVPLHTPLIFAAKNLAYPDNFVHIVAL